MLEILRQREIDPKDFDALMARLGLRDQIKAAKTIVVKPNLVYGTWIGAGSHALTDLALLRDVVVAALEMNSQATVFIAESDSMGHLFAYAKFAKLGLPESLELGELQAKRVQLLDLSRDRLLRVGEGDFKYFCTKDRQLWLSETLVNADFVVSLSNCKTHLRTGFTGACKNLFGCLPAFDKSPYHPQIHKVIHDLTIAVSPQLSVVDAFYAMDGNGPVTGRDIDCGYRVFSSDATEADLCATESAGMTASRIKYLRYLVETTQAGAHVGRGYPTIVKLAKPTAFARAAYGVGWMIQLAGGALEQQGKRAERRRSFADALPRRALPVARRVARRLGYRSRSSQSL